MLLGTYSELSSEAEVESGLNARVVLVEKYSLCSRRVGGMELLGGLRGAERRKVRPLAIEVFGTSISSV